MDTKTFFEWDFNSTLFPLKTNLILIQNHYKALEKYIARILSDEPANVGDNFLPQTRVYAAKAKGHLRRTVVLDPVASYFLYDLTFRNRKSFGKPSAKNRTSIGYKFEGGNPVAVHKAYQDFVDTVDLHTFSHHHGISFDIASYFNSIYHHDATHWFASLPGVTATDGDSFGRFFREINAGRSIDFLPQGIYPAKMIGSEFLRFIELSKEIKSSQSVRFMDDIYLFDNDSGTLLRDFYRIQELLGLRALNINPTKTAFDATGVEVHDAVSEIQSEIESLGVETKNRPMYLGSGGDDYSFDDDDDDDLDDDDDGEGEEDEEVALDDEQVESLLKLLIDPRAEESDVELILGILQEHSDSIATHIPRLISKFPNIVKQLHKIAGSVADKNALTDQLIEFVRGKEPLLEYQIFWIAVIAEDHLSQSKRYGSLILKLYEKASGHKIARAKILEIPDQTFGLKEIRDEILKSGASDWPAWAAAVGTRTLKKAERNYALKYFAKGSPLNFLVAECVQALP